MTPLTLSSPTKASLFPIILWRCWARSEHGITQPRLHDLRWVVRRAAGPKPSPQQAEHVVIWRAGYGALGRLDRVRGVRFLRLTCRAANGPGQPEITQNRHQKESRARRALALSGTTDQNAPTLTHIRLAWLMHGYWRLIGGRDDRPFRPAFHAPQHYRPS